ncbi:NAD(P)H-dependent flavin oxidoreductase [Roseospirillum parvum]|uniref:Nitronate monooxygenase n=1 Tax=Roseospirillum parvum TaxID=83401 RepID=A0A1G7WDH4_9PROT|nr:nitronate monooxygenase family protein [Roseospirillum parvum]SDG69986.1 nitronate monooxygenase [Roseospirillum parvum]
MTLPAALAKNLRLPVIAAPMFLASDPGLVTACRKAGVIGTFPALNQRSSAGLDAWLKEIDAAAGPGDAAYGVNLIVHKSNPRLEEDLEICAAHKVPLIITSLGAAHKVTDRVHDWGGIVLHDVINRRHAEKALEAGVDGLILVGAGAGGHGGFLNPFALMAEIRPLFDGPLILAGAISTGAQIAAARVLGADAAYLGTRFLATAECAIRDDYKQAILTARAADIVTTAAVSGIPGNFLKPSLDAAGIDPRAETKNLDMTEEVKAWRDIWSAGHGVGSITDCPPVAELIQRLATEYQNALNAVG